MTYDEMRIGLALAARQVAPRTPEPPTPFETLLCVLEALIAKVEQMEREK